MNVLLGFLIGTIGWITLIGIAEMLKYYKAEHEKDLYR